MKVLLPGNLPAGAGQTIYRGYSAAWGNLGYESIPTQGLGDWISASESLSGCSYSIMVDDYTLSSCYQMAVNKNNTTQTQRHFMSVYSSAMEIIKKSEKCYVFVQPTKFPSPWGSHPNFICGYSPSDFLGGTGLKAINYLNELDNVHLWTWVEQSPEIKDLYYKEWKKINYIPLAFDSISYKKDPSDRNNHDVCYVGGWANNGFNEKAQIMRSHFKPLMKSKLDCGIFINKNLTHEQENRVLYNSNIALNIHDNYQRILGLDTNERTFKALGLTGILVSDMITAIKNIFPDLPMYGSEDEMMMIIDKYLSNDALAHETKEYYRNEVVKNHTYIHRVQKMTEL
tara:strand:+ start:1360 stop:2385 length:1026 start_codon:yes stop_codon:yes gene_type:complete